jgi:SPP1 gp7 family putative phage head morphogenesis protein
MAWFNLFAKKDDEKTKLKNTPDLTLDSTTYRNEFELPDDDIYEAFDDMNRFDDRLGTNIKKRKQILLSKGYNIEPHALGGDESIKHAEWIRENLFNRKLDLTLDILLNSIGYGFQVVQLKYELNENNEYNLEWAKPIHQTNFDLEDSTGKIIYTGSNADMYVLEKNPQNFIWHVHEISPDGDPRGIGAFHRSYWYYKFKKQDFVLWQKFLERFGVPLLIGKFEAIQDKTKMAAYAATVIEYLKKIRYDSVAALSGGEVETLEAKGNGEAFDKLINICNQAIDIATLGTTMLTNPEGGSFNLAEVHQEILDQQTKTDGQLLSATINSTIIKWLIDANFGVQEYYPVFGFNFDKIATTDEIYKAIEAGIPIDIDWFYSTTGIAKPEDESNVFVINPSTPTSATTDDNSVKKKSNLETFADQADENKAKGELKQLDDYTDPAETSSVILMENDLDRWLDNTSNEYNPTETFIQEIEPLVFSAFFASVLMGRIHTNNDLTGTPTVIDMSKATSINYLKDISTITESTYNKLFLDNYKYAAEVNRLTVYDFKNAIEASLDRARKQGLSKNEWVKEITKPNILQQVGANRTDPWHWNNVYRTNNQTAYNNGVWDRVHETPSSWFGFEYIAIDDSRTTDICASLNGTIKPINDDVWAVYSPPNHYQCRSILARLVQSIAEIDGTKYTPTPKNIPAFPTKSFAGNNAKEWPKLQKSQKERIGEYGIGNDIKKRNKEIEKNIDKIIANIT